MGTRADFYTGRGEDAEWLGSIAWDGYPDSVFVMAPELFAGPELTEVEWRSWVTGYLEGRDDSTKPDQGWPWPWDDSTTSDYAYAFEAGTVYASSFGYPWFRVHPEADGFGEPEQSPKDAPKATFPNMADRQRVALDGRSGALFLGIRDGAP